MMALNYLKYLKEINTADLFCGAGGASTGCDEACRRLRFRRRGVAINHWSIAVDTMRRNHPNLNTLDCKIEEAIPADPKHFGLSVYTGVGKVDTVYYESLKENTVRIASFPPEIIDLAKHQLLERCPLIGGEHGRN